MELRVSIEGDGPAPYNLGPEASVGRGYSIDEMLTQVVSIEFLGTAVARPVTDIDYIL